MSYLDGTFFIGFFLVVF